jgi:hypothetical protein
MVENESVGLKKQNTAVIHYRNAVSTYLCSFNTTQHAYLNTMQLQTLHNS